MSWYICSMEFVSISWVVAIITENKNQCYNTLPGGSSSWIKCDYEGNRRRPQNWSICPVVWFSDCILIWLLVFVIVCPPICLFLYLFVCLIVSLPLTYLHCFPISLFVSLHFSWFCNILDMSFRWRGRQPVWKKEATGLK